MAPLEILKSHQPLQIGLDIHVSLQSGEIWFQNIAPVLEIRAFKFLKSLKFYVPVLLESIPQFPTLQ